jgi:hypothetical protein
VRPDGTGVSNTFYGRSWKVLDQAFEERQGLHCVGTGRLGLAGEKCSSGVHSVPVVIEQRRGSERASFQ